MTPASPRKDLALLLADSNMFFALRGLLGRPEALGIRSIEADLFRHPESDPGCLLRSQDFLQPFVNQYDHALVMFDREGSGKDHLSRDDLERDVEGLLSRSGWGERAAAIVLDPELEIWVWSDSPHVKDVLGWAGEGPELGSWLKERGFLEDEGIKPSRPKEAVQEALRASRKARSSSLYLQLAERVSLARCVDPAFQKLKATLQSWFPPAL